MAVEPRHLLPAHAAAVQNVQQRPIPQPREPRRLAPARWQGLLVGAHDD
jgi:hypothetical protein